MTEVFAFSCPTSFALYCEPLLRWLLEHGANPSTMSTRAHGSCTGPHTPLVEAAEFSDPTVLRLLLAHGAALDPEAMLHAIGRRRQDNGTATMEVLIEHGADVNYVSARLDSPLCTAIRTNAVEKLKLLLDHGADPTSRRSKGSMSALEYASTLGHTHLVHIMEAASGKTAP
jgi:ankyrin repeat protein